MSILDFLTAGAGAIKGGHDYDEEQKQKAMQALSQKLQMLQVMDRIGAVPVTPDAQVNAAMQDRPTSLAPSVGLTPTPIPTSKVPIMHGSAPRGAPAIGASQPDFAPSPISDPIATLAANRVMAPKSLSDLSHDDGQRAQAMHQLTGPRITIPATDTDEEQTYATYPGGSEQRHLDTINAQQTGIEQRQQKRLDTQARIAQLTVAQKNHADYTTLQRLRDTETNPDIKATLKALVPDGANPMTTPEGHWDKVFDIYKAAKAAESKGDNTSMRMMFHATGAADERQAGRQAASTLATAGRDYMQKGLGKKPDQMAIMKDPTAMDTFKADSSAAGDFYKDAAVENNRHPGNARAVNMGGLLTPGTAPANTGTAPDPTAVGNALAWKMKNPQKPGESAEAYKARYYAPKVGK
jgi:hypothetical protein